MAQPLSNKMDWELANPLWAAALNPIVANPILSGHALNNIILANGVTTVNHSLGRNMQGWIITDRNGAATIFRSQPFNSLTLTLTSSAAITLSLWVF